jgi:hypothetical protein
MPGAFLSSDMATFFNANEFGEGPTSVTWKGTPITYGIFDDEDVEFAMGEGVTQIDNQASFTGRSADFAGIADGDAMVIRGVNFRVKNWKDDGTGEIEIFLERR